MVDLSTISTLIVTASVVIGVVFALLELRHLAKTRRTDVIMRIYERFSSKEMVSAIYSLGRLKSEGMAEYAEKYGLVDITEIAVLFEGLGVLLEQGLIDIRLVDSLFGPTLDSLGANQTVCLQYQRIP